MYLHNIPAYVYLIKHRTLGYYYWGSRTANIRFKRQPKDDFWKHYFTSSSTVKALIQEYGTDAWDTELVYLNEDAVEVFWHEQERIKEHIDDPLCLNKKYQERISGNTIFSTIGKIPWNKGRRHKRGTPSWNSGKKAPQISEAKKGVPSPRKGIPLGDAHREKMLEIHRNRSEETCRKISEALTGKKSTPEANAKRSATMKGRKQDPEWIEKRMADKRGKPNIGASLAMKGIPKPKLVCRLEDRKEMSISNYIQWVKTKGPEGPFANPGHSPTSD